MNACQQGFGKLHVEFGADTIECALKDFLQLHACLGVVVFARQVNQAGIEPGVNVATHEQTGTGALTQSKDAHGGVVQLFIPDLK